MKILNCFKEDLSKALVVYNRKRGRKRLRNLIVFNKLLRKRQKTYASRMRTLVVYKRKLREIMIQNIVGKIEFQNLKKGDI